MVLLETAWVLLISEILCFGEERVYGIHLFRAYCTAGHIVVFVIKINGLITSSSIVVILVVLDNAGDDCYLDGIFSVLEPRWREGF